MTNSQILLVSNLITVGPKLKLDQHTAGTRYFFLSIVGISLFSAFSQMTYFVSSVVDGTKAAYGDPVGVLLADSLGFCLTLVCRWE